MQFLCTETGSDLNTDGSQLRDGGGGSDRLVWSRTGRQTRADHRTRCRYVWSYNFTVRGEARRGQRSPCSVPDTSNGRSNRSFAGSYVTTRSNSVFHSSSRDLFSLYLDAGVTVPPPLSSAVICLGHVRIALLPLSTVLFLPASLKGHVHIALLPLSTVLFLPASKGHVHIAGYPSWVGSSYDRMVEDGTLGGFQWWCQYCGSSRFRLFFSVVLGPRYECAWYV